jgi:predicted transcriptional regulator of viral defense system
MAQSQVARLGEILEKTGATAAAVIRLEREGVLVKLSRGLYQLTDSPVDQHHALAEAALLVPRAVVCLLSALAYHELTDCIPARVWVAIGRSHWRPTFREPPLQVVYFSVKALAVLVETHDIDGAPVKTTNPHGRWSTASNINRR